ncbi:unnamed protein product [Dimorphilus gyrociliatus]|uniref:Uncharacterized protein n=1 Tax=Dimorphilus gyrociliatus TaxID=2664684 RepID=A0A7I8W714_9ANNE|nr:unnamed protein product [Dimorphilus gyrociliatus]
MKNMKLFLLAIAVAAVSAFDMEQMLAYVDPEAENAQIPLYNPPIPDDDIEDDIYYKPKACCTPDQWEGYGAGHGAAKKGSHHGRKRILFSEFYHFHYDFKGKRLAYTEFVATSHHRKMNFTMIANFKSKKGYVIYAGNKCKTFSLKQSMHKYCVPQNASYLSSPILGAASDSLKVNAFGGSFHSKRMAGAYMLTFTSKLCIPVSGAVGVKSKRGSAANGFSFFNITPGIKSARVFTPPSSCSKYVDVSEDEVFDSQSDLGQIVHEKLMHGF